MGKIRTEQRDLSQTVLAALTPRTIPMAIGLLNNGQLEGLAKTIVPGIKISPQASRELSRRLRSPCQK